MSRHNPTTQRQLNSVSVHAVTRSLDQAIAAQQRTLPLVVDVSSLKNSQTRKLESPPRNDPLPAAGIRVEWTAPPLSALRSQQQRVTDPSSSSSSGYFSPTTSAPSTTAAVPKRPSPVVAVSFGGDISQYFPVNSKDSGEFPDLLNQHQQQQQMQQVDEQQQSSRSKLEATMLPHPKKNFGEAKPSFFLPVRGGSEHRGIDTVSMDKLNAAIESCPNKDRRAAAQRALAGTSLDRSNIFKGLGPVPTPKFTMLSSITTSNGHHHHPAAQHTSSSAFSSVNVSSIGEVSPLSDAAGGAGSSPVARLPPSRYAGNLNAANRRQLDHQQQDDDELDAALAEACEELEREKRLSQSPPAVRQQFLQEAEEFDL